MYDYLINLILKLGYTPYINESTFSPLYAFQIIIPGMSELVSNTQVINSIIDTKKFNSIIKKIQHINQNEAKWLLEYLNNYPDFEKVSSLIKYNNFKKNNFYSKLKVIQLKILLNLFIDQKNEALVLLRKYNKSYVNDYYKCFENALALIIDKCSTLNIMTILKKYYDDSLITEVLKDIKDNPLQYLIEPNCFDCEKCILASKCYYNAELELYHKIKLIRSNKKEM